MVIKYKCWDKEAKKFLVPDLEHLNSLFVAEGSVLRIVSPERYEFLIWTGFQDINGVDVYPGDVLDNTYYVQWDVLKGAWGLYDERRGAGSLQTFSTYQPHSKDITGNVYESPEWFQRNDKKAS